MPQKQNPEVRALREVAARCARIHFLFIGIYALSIVIFDSWNLIPHEGIAQRWTLAGVFLVLNTLIWYVSRLKFATGAVYKGLVITLVVCGVIFAAFNVYWERGMASRYVALFAVPIITAASLKSRSLLLAGASLSVAAYSTAAVRYFYANYGEGYRVELYGTLFLYSACFFVFALLLLAIIKPRQLK